MYKTNFNFQTNLNFFCKGIVRGETAADDDAKQAASLLDEAVTATRSFVASTVI